MPDIYVALSVIWALAVIRRYKYKSDKRHTLGNASGSYFWKALELNPSLKAFGHWWPVELSWYYVDNLLLCLSNFCGICR